MILAFTPHIGFCSAPFLVSVANTDDALKTGFLLNFYQHFLAQNNHSQHPKARIEFCKDGEPRSRLLSHDALVDKFIKSPLHNISDIDDFADGELANKSGLRLSWIPQVPGKPFVFPVEDVNQAMSFYNILADYDRYLFEDCSGMRVDYANMGFLEMILKDEDGNLLDTNTKWVSWELDTGDDYFDSIDEYMAFLEENKDSCSAPATLGDTLSL